MKKFFILSILIFTFCTGHAQSVIKVFDEEGPVPFVKIKYTTSNDSISKYILTDITGTAKIDNLPSDNDLYLVISRMGYHSVSDTIHSNIEKTYQLIPSSTMIDEVCVTGEYTPTSTTQAVNKITVIKREAILKSGASTLNEILNYQTNIRIQQDNVLGSGLSMGGMSGENVKILQDGVPVIGRLNGNIDLSQINLDNVERIEIVNGPLSVNYGTNALAGTINIITKKNLHPGWSGNIQGYYESIGNYNLSGNLSYRRKNHTIKINGGRKYFDGWRPEETFITFPKETLADTNRALQWNPKLQHFGEIQYIFNQKSWTINPFFRYYQEKITNRGFPLTPYYETAFDDYYYTQRIDQGVNIDRPFKKGNLKAIAGYNYFNRIKNTYFKDLTTLDQSLSPNASDQDTSTFDLKILRVSYSSKRKSFFNYQVGTDINIESSYGKRIKDQTQSIGDYAIYSTAQIELFNKKLTIKPGARYAYNTIFPAPVTPSINLKYDLEKVQIRTTFAQGFRSPTLKELYFDFVDINHNIQGNLDLVPENSLNLSAAITWLKAVQSKNLVKAELSAFYNDFQNLITLGQIADGSFTYINIGEYSTTGLQSEISYRQSNFKAQVNLAYTGRYNFAQSDQLPDYIFSPEVGTNLTYQFLKKKYSINLFYKYNGKLLRYSLDEDDNILTSETDHFQIVDLSISGYFMNKSLLLTVGGKNLLNVKNVNVTGISGSGAHSSAGNLAAGRGTSIFVALNYRFKHYKQN